MIRIKKIKTNDLLSFAAIFIAFLCATNGELSNTNSIVVYYFPFLLCLMALVLEFFVKPKFGLSSYLIWRIGIAAFFLFTMLYAVSASAAFVIIKRFLLQTVVVILIGLKCLDKAENVKLIIKIAVFATFINLVYLLSVIDWTVIARGERLGVSTTNEAWNANNIGMMAAYGAVLAYYIFFICTTRTGIWKTVLSGLLVLFFLAFTVFSGSKKAVIIVLAAALLYILRSSKSHKIRNWVIAILLLGAALYAIYNVPFLYKYIGYRFESFLDALFKEGGDNSSLTRRDMIEVGLKAFINRPILGYGLNGFAQVYGGVTGTGVYSHNNYIEVLVNTGLVGFLLYYSYIIRVLFVKCAANKETALFKAILIVLLITDFGCVSYEYAFYQYTLCLVICGILHNRYTSHTE